MALWQRQQVGFALVAVAGHSLIWRVIASSWSFGLVICLPDHMRAFRLTVTWPADARLYIGPVVRHFQSAAQSQ